MSTLLTNVPPIEWTPEGIILPAESAVLAGVQADYDVAFGGGLNPQLSSPQGQLASSQSACVADKNSEIAYIVSQVDPQYASGRFQDAIGRLYMMTRIGATATAVVCNLGGLTGTVIPAGTLAQDTSGNTYSLTGSVTIPSSGTISSQWQNVTSGPIPCAPTTLTQVYQAISGWDTISNPAAGVLGQDVETQQEFEVRRQNSVAANAHGTTQSIYAACFDPNQCPGVLDVCVVDNSTGAPVNYGPTAYPLAPTSLYVAVVGGTPSQIAQAIWNKKDVGCSYNGNTSVVVTDPTYATFGPQYTVKFNIPTTTPVLFAVDIVNSPSLPSNIQTIIQNAIIAQFTGQAPNSSPQRIASTISALSYVGAILAAAPGTTITLLSVAVGITTATLNQVALGIDQSPTISPANITVTLT